MSENAKELNKENVSFRFEFGNIIKRCNKEIMFAEIARDNLRKSFAEEIKMMAQKQLERGL